MASSSEILVAIFVATSLQTLGESETCMTVVMATLQSPQAQAALIMPSLETKNMKV